jgi:hypothetical protein
MIGRSANGFRQPFRHVIGHRRNADKRPPFERSHRSTLTSLIVRSTLPPSFGRGDMKYFIFAGWLLAALAFDAGLSSSDAGLRNCPHGGYCPPGSCAKFNGVRYACNVKNCSPKNCLH